MYAQLQCRAKTALHDIRYAAAAAAAAVDFLFGGVTTND